MKIFLLAIIALSFTGCAFLKSTTETGPEGTVTTRVTSYTLWDSDAALAKFQNRGVLTRSNEWAPGTSIGSLSQASTSTNINELISSVVAAAVKAAIKP